MQYTIEITELLETKDFNAAHLKYAQYRENLSPSINFMPFVRIVQISYLSSFSFIVVCYKNTVWKSVIQFYWIVNKSLIKLKWWCP